CAAAARTAACRCGDAGGSSRRGHSDGKRFLRTARRARRVGGGRNLRTLLETDTRGTWLASVWRRPLASDGRRLVLGERRAVGLGHLPLRPLGLERGVWLDLGAAH